MCELIGPKKSSVDPGSGAQICYEAAVLRVDN